MSNFSRAIRIALRHRLTVVASILCSFVVAILWAANIATVLPVVDGVMQNKSVPQLIDETISTSNSLIAECDEKLETIQKQLTRDASLAQDKLRGQQMGLEYRRDKAQTRRAFWKWLQPSAHRWLPATPFYTLMAVCIALFVGTFVKSLFRIAGSYFMARLGQLTDFELRKEFYRRTLQLDLATFRQTSPGDLLNRFTGEIAAIAAGTQTVFGMAIREPLKMVACLLLAAWVSWQ